MHIQPYRILPRLLRLMVLAVVIGITWYVYEDYVRTTSAQSVQDGGVENKVVEQKDKSVVQGVIEIVPKPKGILIVPAE